MRGRGLARHPRGLWQCLPRGPAGKLTAAAVSLYEPPPDEKELDAFGLKLSDYDTTLEIWPENFPAVDLFTRLHTQWTYSFRGREGLNYLVLFTWIDRLNLAREDADCLIEDIQHLEREALKAMRSN